MKHAIDFFADKSLMFDFGGGTKQGLANFYMGFGGQAMTYSFLQVNKLSWLIKFLKKSYDITINKKNIMYTKNEKKKGSYHYCVPLLNASIPKLKEIHKHFRDENKEEFIYTDEDGKIKYVVDTTIYSTHWFRCPNQSKAGEKKTKHIIIKGEMKDFIFDYKE